MNSLMLLDWMGQFVSQILVQCQFWCWLVGLVVVVAVFIGVGLVILELLEGLDRNDVGPAMRH